MAPNQPAPLAGRVHLYWLVFLGFLLAAAVAQFGFMALNAAGRSPSVPFLVDVGGASRTTSEPFEVGGTFAGPVTVRTSSNANDSWLALGMQFTEVGSGRSWRLDRQLGYRGVGTAREGGSDDVAEIASLPPGRYVLTVDARSGPFTGTPGGAQYAQVTGIIHVTRNAVAWSNFFLFAGFLALWPLGVWMKHRAFEARRWAESDYASGSGGSGDNDDD